MYNGWARLRTVSPNSIVSNQAVFRLTCAGEVTSASATVTEDPDAQPQMKPAQTGCPVVYRFDGTITTNGPGPVTYQWERSDGTIRPRQTVEFPEAGSQVVTDTWQIDNASNIGFAAWARLRTITPNEVESNMASFDNPCSYGSASDTIVAPDPVPATPEGVAPHDDARADQTTHQHDEPALFGMDRRMFTRRVFLP